MNRKGFALVATLWLLAALSATAAGIMELARGGHRAAVNRISLARGRWAAEACEAILRARFADRPTVRSIDSVDLGRGVWCTARPDDPQALINLNTADLLTLQRALGSVPLGAAVRAARPLSSVRQLRLIPGLERVQPEAMERFFTVSGAGQVNVNTASASVLAALPSLDGEILSLIAIRRRLGVPFQSAEDLLDFLDPASRLRLESRGGAQAVSMFTFQSARLLLVLRGGVSGSPAIWGTTIEVAPSGKRLAVIARGVQ